MIEHLSSVSLDGFLCALFATEKQDAEFIYLFPVEDEVLPKQSGESGFLNTQSVRWFIP